MLRTTSANTRGRHRGGRHLYVRRTHVIEARVAESMTRSTTPLRTVIRPAAPPTVARAVGASVGTMAVMAECAGALPHDTVPVFTFS